MGRMYIAPFSGVSLTATTAIDLFELLSGSGVVSVIHEIGLVQTSDVRDAEEEILKLEEIIGIGSVTGGSAGSTGTVIPQTNSDTAFSGTFKYNNSTRMAVGSGSLKTGRQFGWNVRMPFEKIFTPETRPTIAPGNRWTLGMTSAGPADALSGVAGYLLVEEIG